MCSNQRRLSIGTGVATKIQNVHVHWLSGSHEAFGDILVGEDCCSLKEPENRSESDDTDALLYRSMTLDSSEQSSDLFSAGHCIILRYNIRVASLDGN